MTTKSNYPYTILHIAADGCNQPFVYTNRASFKKGEYSKSEFFMKLDETIPVKGDRMECGTCGKQVWWHHCKNEHIINRYGSKEFNII